MRGSISENWALVTSRERLSDGKPFVWNSAPASGNAVFIGVGAIIMTTPGQRNRAFGMMSAADLDEAVALANDTPFGLSASLFTSNLANALRYVRDIEVGLVRVNGDTTGVDPHAPFGGMKSSSSGSREQGRAAREFYTETRTVQVHS